MSEAFKVLAVCFGPLHFAFGELCLRSLQEKKIHSAPVWDTVQKKYIGIIDINDIIK